MNMKKTYVAAAGALALSLISLGANAQETYVPYGDIFAGEREVTPYENVVNAGEKARMASGGIMIVGSGPQARAFSAFGGGAYAGAGYAAIINKYHKVLGDGVRVYCMPIPTESAFYTPDCMVTKVKDQGVLLNNMFSKLDPEVEAVDIFTILGAHAYEDIYSRTDHHWLPLGAYYAARKFASVAAVPFNDLNSYEEHVIKRFVGSMYSFSKDAAVKNAPEDFVYYIPQGVEYNTTYYRNGSTTTGDFFKKYPDGSGAAYLTFMGGDIPTTKVVTSTKNGRKLIILKDSFGNAIPGYLFYSFEEIHVIDCRYFNKNIVKYVQNNGITDIVFANNLAHACAKSIINYYEKYLVM